MFIALFVSTAYAGDTTASYEILEMFGNNIKISKDGTGIVNNVKCKVCTSKVLTITKETKAYVDGKAVDIVKTKQKYGNKVAMIRFDVATNKVILIRW
jgi:hypothetical protein